MMLLGGLVYAQELIVNIDSYASADPDDDDEIYRAGQSIKIVVEYAVDEQPAGAIEINSETTGYGSQVHTMGSGTGSTLVYNWITVGLGEADDYVVSVTLTDNAEQEDTDNSLVITIDNTPPRISTVISHDSVDTTDDDGIYHAGQNIAIDVQVTDGTGLESTVQIKSDAVGYDSGIQRLTAQSDDLHRYIWVTTALNPAKDYAATVIFRDQVGLESRDSSLRMEIDNTEPQNGKMLINDDEVYAISRSVSLSLSADGATRIHVSGDVVDDVSTFEWRPYSESLIVNLTEGDGTKTVSVRFMDDASNQSAPATDTIILDEEPPVITSVRSHDEGDALDDDGMYHAGQSIVIVVETDGSDLIELEGLVQIASASVNYDSGLQALDSVAAGSYIYTWNTIGLIEADDYAVSVRLKDPSDREVSDDSLIMIIDNTPPSGGEVRINDGEAETDSRSVTLTISASGEPREVFIDGDLIDDSNTSEWIAYTNQIVVNLTDTDGEKEVVVKFRDAARNVSGITTASIKLDRQAPTSTSIIIEDGATYTTTRNISIDLQAVNAERMLIDGDIVDDAGTFDWIDYSARVSIELSAGDGEKSVGVIFRNKVGIQSDRIEDTIILDTSVPVILSVDSSDSEDRDDDDEIFHPGQMVIISVTAESGEAELSALIRIRSQSAAYDTGEQEMSDAGTGTLFTYTWDTNALQESDDYVVSVELTDAAGHKAQNSDMTITIDSSPPVQGQIAINDGEESTDSRTVRLRLSAVDAVLMFLSGDLIDDSNTFQWIPYRTRLTVNLSGGDGEKTVYVRFRDAADNESALIQDTITLDRESPYDLKMIIASTSEGAAAGEPDQFATSQQVFLNLVAQNAVEVYVSGDVANEDNTFEWMPYSAQLTVDLTKGDGEKTVYANFRNERGIEGEQIEGMITLDTSPPDILSVSIQDAGDPNDNDGQYHPGETVRIVVEVLEANEPEAEIRIKSESTGYDSGAQTQNTRTSISADTWRLEYVWDTTDLDEGTDFTIEVRLTDAAGWAATSDPEIVVLDGTPPANAEVKINGGAKRTASRMVTLRASADDAAEMLVTGDIRDDDNTFQWVPVRDSMTVILAAGDGMKNVAVRFRDMAENETDTAMATVILSRVLPVVEQVDSWDTSDSSDNDEQYHAGELVRIAVKAQASDDAPMIETGLLAEVSVSSDTGYDSGEQKAREEDNGWYTYSWDTTGLAEGTYQVTWNLSDGVGHEVSDNSLSISIDNTPPAEPQIAVNDGAKYTRSRAVNLYLRANGASWVFIDGAVLEEKGSTLEWIPFDIDDSKITVRLSGSDGVKLVQARFKDDADNVTDIVAQSITLDTVGPDAVSAEVNNGADYAVSTEVHLALVADDAAEMYISGDIAVGPNIRQWIPYQEETSLELTEGDGGKTVNVEFKDIAGNYSDEISDTIILDTTSPEVASVGSVNTADPADDDGRYLEGTQVEVRADAGETELSATIQISSLGSGYSSGIQEMTDAGGGIYTYSWDTSFLQDAEDYTVTVKLEDKAGNTIVDNSLVIAILDELIAQEISINGGEAATRSQSVQVTLLADNAAEMYISGDVVDDSNTFRWVEFASSKQLNLTQGDGDKSIRVIFRDSLSREIGTSEAAIILDQKPPSITKVKTSKKIYSAGNTAEIVIQAGKQEAGLKGTIRVRSLSTGYDSGIQNVTESVAGEYLYLWDMTGLKEGQDYRVEATLTDKAEWTAKNHSLTIAIDNTPPSVGEFTVNAGKLFTQKRSVELAFAPQQTRQEAVEMLVEGDVVRDSNTFQWIPISALEQRLIINLTVGDGRKRIDVSFRDEAGNRTEPIKNTIVLNELPPVIIAVDSQIEDDPLDEDEIYHAGQRVMITIAVDDREELASVDEEDTQSSESQLEAWVQITSQESGYDSNLLIAIREFPSEFRVVWDTHSVPQASDYAVVATLQDGYGQRTTDATMIITIDNTPPAIPGISIGGGRAITNTRSVMISLTAEDVVEILVEGDIAESAGAFQWVPFVDTRKIQLSEGDGTKNISVKVRDSAGNISESTSASIVLDRSIPSAASISINDGAEYTESHQVILSLSAKSSREMYISGDVVQDKSNFRWIPFQGSYSTRLTEGEGEKTVRAVFRNGVGNEGGEVEARIVLDFSPPAIAGARAFDALDETDDNLNFHAGQPIVLEATGDETGLKGWVFIHTEEDSAQPYESGRQSMTDMDDGSYIFLWNTEGIADGNYLCEFTLEDIAGHSVTYTLEIAVDNQGPDNPSISVNTEEPLALSRTIEVSLRADGDPAEVFIAGDVVNDDGTFEWIPFSPNEDAIVQTILNLRGIDGEKTITAVFRDKARSESSVAEAVISLELERPELADSCRIIQTDVEPVRAYLALQFSESISRTDPKNLFLTLRDKASPQNVVHLDGVTTEPILSNDIVMLEISPEQLDEIKQWQPMTFAASYIRAEIAEDGVFDLADRGNLSNEQTPADVFFVSPFSSLQVEVDHISFSPNGDEVKDEATISYLPARDSDVTIRIRDTQREVVKEWLVDDQVGGLVYSVEWSGKKPDGTPYPDGEYTLIIMGSEVGVTGFAYGLKYDLTIDNSPPQIVDVRPREEGEIASLFRASISVFDTPKIDGIESAYITIGGDIENRIPLAKSETEGEYVMPATSELLLPPGNVDVGFHVVDMAGNEAEQSRSYKVVVETEAEFSLMNFPNPFPPGETTTIRYSLPGRAIRAEIAIYDAGGDMVFFREMRQEELEIGEHSFQWNGRDMFEEILARGVYFCRLWVTTEAEDENKTHKIAIR